MIAGILLGLASPVSADEDHKARPFGDWLLVGPPTACQLMTQVMSRSTGAMILEFTLIAPRAFEQGARAGVRVPTGASLRDGIAFRHPQGPVTALEWQSCNAEMCLAAVDLGKDALDRILRESRVIVGFRPLPGARLVNIEVSLRGTSAGWAALQDC